MVKPVPDWKKVYPFSTINSGTSGSLLNGRFSIVTRRIRSTQLASGGQRIFKNRNDEAVLRPKGQHDPMNFVGS